MTSALRLLDHNPHGVEPTIYARELLDRGLIAFDELRQAVKHFEFLANPAEGAGFRLCRMPGLLGQTDARRNGESD